jgi:IS5 family transposase
VAELNEALLAKAAEAKLVRLDALRADTTVVPANVAHPSDAGLLAKGVISLAKLTARLKALGFARRSRFRDRARSIKRRSHAIGTWMRRRSDQAKEEVLAITAEMVTIAEAALADSAGVIRNTRRKLNSTTDQVCGQAVAALSDLERTAALLGRVIDQTRVRVSGGMPDGATRVVSYHDPDARPIAKGRIGKPVEFGYKAQVVDNRDGLIVDHQLVLGNPSDAPLLAPAIRRVKARFGRPPRTVSADRGYGDSQLETDLQALGVKDVVIPRRGRPNHEGARLQRSARFGCTPLTEQTYSCRGTRNRNVMTSPPKRGNARTRRISCRLTWMNELTARSPDRQLGNHPDHGRLCNRSVRTARSRSGEPVPEGPSTMPFRRHRPHTMERGNPSPSGRCVSRHPPGKNLHDQLRREMRRPRWPKIRTRPGGMSPNGTERCSSTVTARKSASCKTSMSTSRPTSRSSARSRKASSAVT